MNKNILIGSAELLLAALIWGLAFSAQRTGMKYLSPEAFTSIRSFIGVAVLIPIILLADKFRKTPLLPAAADERKTLLIGGFWCGFILSFASTTQQYGLIYASAGKAGFITSLYIIFVPLAGIFFGHKVNRIHWLAVALALGGSYMLCTPGNSGAISAGDLWLLACAILFAGHILVIAHYAPKTDCIKMSCIQFITAGILTGTAAIIKQDEVSLKLLSDSAIALLYCGICSSGIAFTLQIVSQKHITGATASILMSMESVFSVLGGYIFLKEKLSAGELAGCTVIFAAVVIAQLPQKEITYQESADNSGEICQP